LISYVNHFYVLSTNPYTWGAVGYLKVGELIDIDVQDNDQYFVGRRGNDGFIGYLLHKRLP
jgi:hypothetical protein